LQPVFSIRITAIFALMVAMSGCSVVRETGCAPGEARAVNDLMYFGTARSAGVVTPAEWAEFLRTSVAPRFPPGLTVWQASGQWKAADGTIVREATFVLSLVHPDDHRSEAAVRAITAEYKSRFDQEAVLRIRSHACTSF